MHLGAYYIDEYTYNSNFTQEIDDIIHAPAMLDQALGLEANSSIIGGRVHGNPNLESANVGWQESPARMRDQDEVYRAAVVSGDDNFEFKKLFSKLPDVWKTSGGFHVIEADDPMLVEQGEAFIHKQFTDYMSANVCDPQDEWDTLCSSYIFKHLLNNIALGVVPAAVVVEPVRQLLGLPYDWHGAPNE